MDTLLILYMQNTYTSSDNEYFTKTTTYGKGAEYLKLSKVYCKNNGEYTLKFEASIKDLNKRLKHFESYGDSVDEFRAMIKFETGIDVAIRRH